MNAKIPKLKKKEKKKKEEEKKKKILKILTLILKRVPNFQKITYQYLKWCKVIETGH